MEPIGSEGFSIQKMIKWLSNGRRIHICIHYLSGEWQANPALAVLPQNKVHYCHFCNTAKLTSRGLRYCMRNKRWSIRKALALKKPYIGQCYLGITEIVKPVFIGKTPFCTIYVGNIIRQESESAIKANLQRMAGQTGVAVERLVTELETTAKLSTEQIQEYQEIAEVIGAAIELYCAANAKILAKPMPKKPTANIHWVVKQALDYIDQYYYTDLKLSQIAGLYFINEQYLCKLFSKQTGTTFTSYLNQIRVKNAKQLLAASNRKIIEIATAVGFNNVTYFNLVFKQTTGMTPQAYRRDTGAGNELNSSF